MVFVLHLKHSSFFPLAGVEPLSNDLMHAMPWLYSNYLYNMISAYNLKNKQRSYCGHLGSFKLKIKTSHIYTLLSFLV